MTKSRQAWGLGGASVALAIAAGVLLWGPWQSDRSDSRSDPPWFEDATENLGLKFTHDAGPTGAYFFPQIMGSGAALLDCDLDGRLDIYLLQNAGPDSPARNQLWRQKADGTFENISAGSGLDVAGHFMGVAVGDVNNDGWPDVVLTGFRGVRLFLNNGDCTFTEATKEAGLDGLHWATSASFLDFDRDGWLDLVVVNYVAYDPAPRLPGAGYRNDFSHPSAFNGTSASLYRNLGKQADGKVRFRDVTVSSGLGRRPSAGLGVLCADLNGDGWPDILVANDSRPNHLWINQKDGTFQEEAVLRGCAYNAAGRAEANMGIAFGDVQGKGMLDLVVTHLSEETNTFWQQGPPGFFTDRTNEVGLAAPKWKGTGFGAVLADFNHDGHLDLAVVNGRVYRAPGAGATSFQWSDYAERDQLFAQDGTGKFRDLSSANPALSATPRVGRALCFGDICGNGRVDLLATYVNGPARIYRNVAPQLGHWLIVQALLPEWKRDAYGAVVTVSAGGRQWMRLIQPGSGYLGSNDPRGHFGLGSADRIDAIRVQWPNGDLEDFPGGPVDRRLTVRQGEGTKLEAAP